MTAGYTCTRKTTEFASDDEIFFKMPDFDAVSMAFLSLFVNRFPIKEETFYLMICCIYSAENNNSDLMIEVCRRLLLNLYVNNNKHDKMKRKQFTFLMVLLSVFLGDMLFAADGVGGSCETAGKQRVLISTDIGGTDPDDNQSMAHALMYTDCFDLEGLVSSPSYGSGSKEEILRMISLYEKDLPRLKKHFKNLMTPRKLRSITKQGRKGAAPFCGYATPTEGSRWIVECARRKSDRPLWVSVWGGLEDVAQALHDAPDIADKIRVHWIGGPNKKWSVNSYAYIVENFPNLWIIENNASYRGFIAGKKQSDRYNAGYYETYMKGAGHIGADFINYYGGLPKMGDTPALLYVMNGDPYDPQGESWGGSFEPTSRSSRPVFHRPTTERDTVPVYSIIEFHVKGPVRSDIAPDSVCFKFEIRNQTWDGFYLGDGDYVVRHSTYYLGTLQYKITSHIPGFPHYEGAITVENTWPGREYPTDYMVGPQWFTDKSNTDLFWHNQQGAQTVYKWRQEVMEDWGGRLEYLK